MCSASLVQASEVPKSPPLPSPFPKLLPLHTRLSKPAPGEWLAEHPEPGQTYLQYVRSNPVRPDRKRRMFSMAHCTLFECNMCASNHLEEADRRPFWLCPQCLAKLCWATNADPREHFQRLAAFAEAQGFTKEGDFYEKSLATIGGK